MRLWSPLLLMVGFFSLPSKGGGVRGLCPGSLCLSVWLFSIEESTARWSDPNFHLLTEFFFSFLAIFFSFGGWGEEDDGIADG